MEERESNRTLKEAGPWWVLGAKVAAALVEGEQEGEAGGRASGCQGPACPRSWEEVSILPSKCSGGHKFPSKYSGRS